MNVPFIDLTREWKHFESRFVQGFQEFGSKGQYVLGEYTENFEQAFAKFCGYKYAAAVSTGLTALETSLRAHNIGAGDEVITVSNSAVATALSISHVGATPVFCDIGEDFLMDPKQLEDCITEKTKVILPVHLFGSICNMEAINNIAKKHDVVVIEDACQAHGSTFRGASAENTKAFSFYPTKNLGAMGEGGMVVMNDEKVRDFVTSYRNYGQEGRYNHIQKGNNYRLAPLQCMILNIKLADLSHVIERRREIAKMYIDELSSLVDLEINTFSETSSYHLFVIRVKNGRRNALQEFLKEQGIDSLIHYPTTIHEQPCYRDEYARLSLPVTDAMQGEMLSLPCYPFLGDTEQVYVIKKIVEFYKK